MVLLLAEDDENDVVLFKRASEKAGLGIRLQRVSDGEEAIAYLRGLNAYEDRDLYPFPDLLILDLKMPRKTGFDVIEWVRKSDARRLRMIVLTSSKEARDVNRAYESGVNSYLVKPHKFEQLVEMLKNFHTYWRDVSEAPEVPKPLPGKT